MKYWILIFGLLLIAASYNENASFSFNGYEHNFSAVVGDRVVVETEYGRFFLQENECVQFDTHLWCTENVTYDRVEYYPYEYRIVVEREEQCKKSEGCNSYGNSCEALIDCVDYCVHGTCRPTRTWCGDGVCDDGETCSADCSAETNETEPVNTTTNQSVVITTNESSSQNFTNQTVENTTTALEPTQQQEDVQPVTSTPDPALSASSADDGPNVLAAGLTVFGGVMLIVMLFNRKKKKQRHEEQIPPYEK